MNHPLPRQLRRDAPPGRLRLTNYLLYSKFGVPKMDEIQQLKRKIAELEARLSDLQKRLPAHSIKPALLAELDELDELLIEARARLAWLTADA